MKILLVTEFFPTGRDLKFSGGVEARTFYLAKHLAKNNKVNVIASKIKGVKKFENMFGFSVYRVGPNRNYQATSGDIFNRLKFISEAIKVGIDLKPDIVDGANFIAHFISKRISAKNKIPVCAWYPDVWVGSWVKNAGLFGIFGEILERFNLFSGFDAYIAISKSTAVKLKKLTDKKIHVIDCGVDQKEFQNDKKKFPDPTIICVSRLAKYKNIRTLIFVFAHLSTKVKNARLLVIGSGPELKNLKGLVRALKLNTKVRFLNNLPRKNLIKLYGSSHIFSLPSFVEGFGISTIEAAAAGLPYVNSNIDVQREVTKNGQGGFLVDPDELLMFSKRFYQLIADKKLYQKKSRDARQLAKNYDWERIAKETEKVYRGLL